MPTSTYQDGDSAPTGTCPTPGVTQSTGGLGIDAAIGSVSDTLMGTFPSTYQSYQSMTSLLMPSPTATASEQGEDGDDHEDDDTVEDD